jgi:hypothetical protein
MREFHLPDFLDRPYNKGKIAVERAIEHVTHVASTVGCLLVAMRTHFTAQRSDIVEYVIAVGRLNNMHNLGKMFFQSALKLRRETAVAVPVAVYTPYAHFLLHRVPILFKHDGPPSGYESQSSNSRSGISIGNELKFLFRWSFAPNARTCGFEPRTIIFVTAYAIVIATMAVNASHIPLRGRRPFFIVVVLPDYISIEPAVCQTPAAFLAFIAKVNPV